MTRADLGTPGKVTGSLDLAKGSAVNRDRSLIEPSLTLCPASAIPCHPRLSRLPDLSTLPLPTSPLRVYVCVWGGEQVLP